MFAMIKMLIGTILLLAGAASILVAFQKWTLPMKLIFGKEKVKKRGTKLLSMYMYVVGGILVLVGLMVMF